MKNDEKFEFIREKFCKNSEKMPEALKRENIISSLENVEQQKQPKAFPKKALISFAAAFAVTLVSVFALNTVKADKQRQKENDYSDIIEYFEEIKNEKNHIVTDSEISGFARDTVIMKADAYNSAKSAAPTSPAYGKTNIQVEDIDEADIVKNDGEYLYFVRGESVLIYSQADLKRVSEIKPVAGDKKNISIKDIYVSGNRLVVITSVYEMNNRRYYIKYDYAMTDGDTRCFVYDIEDRKKPELVFTQIQSGYYSTSRLSDNVLYTVSDYSAYFYTGEDNDKEEVVPEVNGKKIKRTDITLDKKGESSNYVVISACDISDNKPGDTSYAYLGAFSNECYCNNGTMYISGSFYPDDEKMKNLGLTQSCVYTGIYAVSLSKEKISFKNEGIVKGGFLNQLSMDEYNGYFRCATTNYNEDTGEDESNIYILDADLKTVGRAENLKDGEEVKAVRFMGDTAYVVTYENTDPLFIIDLSVPENPKIAGEVELPGFSAYLHPLDENYIVGIGDGGDENGSDDSLKITLFDISDKRNPLISDSFIIEESDTEIDYNFKAFVYYPEKQLIGIPVMKNVVNRQSYGRIQKYIFLKNENGKLVSVNTYTHDRHMTPYDEDLYVNEETEYVAEFFRGTYTGETVFTVSERKICAFDIESAEKRNEVKF